VSNAFFANVGEWADAGKGFQLAFQPMIEQVLRPLEYGADGMDGALVAARRARDGSSGGSGRDAVY